MSDTENKSIVLQFYKFFDERKMEESMKILSTDFIAHMAGIPEPMNKDRFGEFGNSFYSAFIDSHHQFDEVIVTEDKVVTCGTFVATHRGKFRGLPATGKRITLSVMHIDRLKEGKIVEHWGQGDALGLMQQLGIIFFPGPKLIPHMLRSIVSRQSEKSAV